MEDSLGRNTFSMVASGQISLDTAYDNLLASVSLGWSAGSLVACPIGEASVCWFGIGGASGCPLAW